MELKLAEYDLQSGKFLKYIPIDKAGDDQLSFLLAKDYINIASPCHFKIIKDSINEYAQLDKTDPLNRFKGLFDGRTYGEGRFVLEIDNQDTYAKWEGKFHPLSKFIVDKTRIQVWDEKTNLHQSPQLSNLKN